MPIYEYVCSACGHRSDILHGHHDPGPHFCPECGAEGTMRKAFAPPAIHFKGSGWAKKDRNSATRTKAADKSDSSVTESKGGAAKPAGSPSGATTDSPKAADPQPSASSSPETS